MTEIEAETTATNTIEDTTTEPALASTIDSENTTAAMMTTTTIGDDDIINVNANTSGGQYLQSQPQQKRASKSNKHKLTALREKGELSPSLAGSRMAIESKQYGNVCYADPNELFPQATYYLRPDLKRPEYHTNNLNNNDNESDNNNKSGDEVKGGKKRKSRSSVGQSDTPLTNEDDGNKKGN